MFCLCRIGSGKEVANVIVDNGKDDDEDDTFVVDDSHLQQQNHTDSVSFSQLFGISKKPTLIIIPTD